MPLNGARVLGIVFLMLVLFVCTSKAQNTKGDRPAPANRDNRFKTPLKKYVPRKKPGENKRVRIKERSFAARASTGSPRRRASGVDRPGKPIRPLARTQPSSKQKAWRGDIAGVRIRSRSSAGNSRRNIYPQYGRYTHNPSKKPKPTENAASNRGTLARLRQLETHESPPPGKRRRVVPRSASRSYTARKSINVYANFARPKRKGERATVTDLAGRPLRKKNFESSRPGVIPPLFKPYYHRGAMGDKAYSGKVGGYKSASRQGRAWTGDIAGRRIRGRNFTSKRSIEGQPILPSGNNRSATRGHTGAMPLPSRVPGIGASGINKFQGHTRARRPFKGGGSVSGRVWNNKGQAIEVQHLGQGVGISRFKGNVKASRPLKGGGSVSGRLWNNNGQPILVRTPGIGGRAALYSGSIKARRPDKGMPDVSGSLPRKGLPAGAKKVNGYVGKWKRFELQPGFGDMGETFTGYIKRKKFGRDYAQHPDAAEESIKKRRLKKSALAVEGLAVKIKRPEYVQNEHAADESIMKRRLKKSAFDVEGLAVKVKRPDYIENKNAADDALLKKRPSRSNIQAGELQVRVKQREYSKKPNAAEGSLPGIKPSKTSVKASEYARSVKRNWDYIRNPSSADEALKTREPGKAFARVSAYQGNIKMQKFALFEKNRASHPDTKFIKPNKNNVDEERDAMTNFKLWWARLFKKEETQPDHLRYKGGKPRYDKGEQGLWYK